MKLLYGVQINDKWSRCLQAVGIVNIMRWVPSKNWNSSICCPKWDTAPSKTSFSWFKANIKVTFCALTYLLFLLFHVWSLSGHLQPPPTPPPPPKKNEWINKYPPHLNALLRGCFFFHDISVLYFNATTCHSNCYVKWSFRYNDMKSNLAKVVTDFARRSSCPNFFHFFQYLSNFEFHWQISTWVFGLPMDMIKFPRNR